MQICDALDLVGIGFGPAGVALAAAIDDLAEENGVDYRERVRFYEREQDSGWQRGLLFRNADIQHHYMRDLATPRNPRSRYTFANFLKEHDRIFAFGSLVYGGGGGAVSRVEWSNYVAWAADRLSTYVRYGDPVVSVRPAGVDGEDLLAVATLQGEVLTRAVAFCAGQDPAYPAPLQPHVGERVFHATRFLDRIGAFDRSAALRFCIVGAGQSAIETLLYVHAHFPEASVTCVQRSLGFHHGDHSPFVQRMFHPKESDAFLALDAHRRREVLREVARANYAAVDREAVSALYRTLYEDEILGIQRVRMLTGTEIEAAHASPDGVRLETVSRDDGATRSIEADVVVAATGFSAQALPPVLDPLRPLLSFDELGGLELDHGFAARPIGGTVAHVFVPGAAEASHGLGASNSFSMIAVKAGRVTESLCGRGLLAPRGQDGRRTA